MYKYHASIKNKILKTLKYFFNNHLALEFISPESQLITTKNLNPGNLSGSMFLAKYKFMSTCNQVKTKLY